MKSTIDSKKVKFWRSHMAGAAAREGSLRSYCERAGITVHCFHYWKRRLAGKVKHDSAPSAAGQFVAVNVERVSPIAPPMPDARWVAEFVMHLCGGGR